IVGTPPQPPTEGSSWPAPTTTGAASPRGRPSSSSSSPSSSAGSRSSSRTGRSSGSASAWSSWVGSSASWGEWPAAVSPRTERPWLTRNLAVLSGVSLLQDSASELLYPVLPVFLTVVLGAPPAVVGLVEGLAEGGAAGARLVAGRLADRFARRPLVAAGYGLAALGKVLVAAATGWPVVLAGRVVDRVGKGLRGTPRDALLADGVVPSEFGRVYGFHRRADTLRALLGPAAYAALGHRIRPLLWVAVVPAVASVLLVFAVREARPAAPGPAHPDAPVDLARLPPTYWARRRPAHGLRPVNFPDALLLLLRAGELGLSVGAVILVYVAFNVSYAALSFPAVALADRWPRARVFAIGLG